MPKRKIVSRDPSARTIAAIIFLQCLPLCDATPSYFSTVANQALRMQGGARLGGDLDVSAIYQLEQQVKRVMGADPASSLNVSALKDAPETELLRLLFLAVLGNFTSAAGAEWNRPCSLVIDPMTGLVRLQDAPPLETLALKIVLVLLVAVQVRQWVRDIRSHASAPTGEALPLGMRDHLRKAN
jgi:hypothetical protein